MEDRRRFRMPAVGGSSLLVIFAVLCLTVFALLSLSTVQADRRLSDAASEAVENYYEADTEAESVLAALRRGERPRQVTVTSGESGEVFAYAVPFGGSRELRVEVVFPGETEGEEYTIRRWQAVSTQEWTPENEGEKVWDGQ